MGISGKIASVVGIVVLLLFAVIPNLPESPNSVPEWQYDDYRPLEDFPGLTSVSGSLEIVTVGDTDYVHARSVGKGMLVYGSKTTSIEVEKAILDLIYLYGQSNVAYRNAEPSLVDVEPLPGRTYYFGLSDRYASTAAENETGMDYSACSWYDMINLYSGEWRVGDKAPSLAHYYNALTGHKVYIVDGAIGNKSITSFRPTDALVWVYGDHVLTRALTMIDTDLYDYSVKYYVWIQGEANASTPIDSYKDGFMMVHNSLLAGRMAGVHFEKCFISLLPEKWTNSREAQLQLAEEHPDTVEIATEVANTFTVENGLLNADQTHYTQLGNNILGKAIGTYIARSTEEPTPIYVTLLNLTPIVIGVLLIIAIVDHKR